MYIVKANRWKVNSNREIVGDVMLYEFRGNTLKEAMSNVRDAKDNWDSAQHTPINIYNVINTEEQTSK